AMPALQKIYAFVFICVHLHPKGICRFARARSSVDIKFFAGMSVPGRLFATSTFIWKSAHDWI
ncbi:MAG: hypothetical protein ACC650_04280, partial [Gammaproteobacteria bacterium]